MLDPSDIYARGATKTWLADDVVASRPVIHLLAHASNRAAPLAVRSELQSLSALRLDAVSPAYARLDDWSSHDRLVFAVLTTVPPHHIQFPFGLTDAAAHIPKPPPLTRNGHSQRVTSTS